MDGMRILVTGASGFVGSRLIPRLRCDGHRVRALARDPARVDRAEKEKTTRSPDGPLEAVAGDLEVVGGDVLAGKGLARALKGIEVAYYLIHSMERAGEDGTPFPERERRAAERFAAAAAAAGVRRIVYLGGPTAGWTPAARRVGGDGGDGNEVVALANEAGANEAGGLSAHLRSREAVEQVLRGAIDETVVLRASIVIGARSRSFRLLVRLVERMPVLPLPAWRSHRTRPIDARDIVDMLAAAADPATVAAGCALDVGGPEILGYGEMVERIAELMLLARPAVGLGVNATRLTARVAGAIAGEDPELVSALMESLRGDLLPDGGHGDAHLRAAALLGVRLHSFDSAVECALREWEADEPLAAR